MPKPSEVSKIREIFNDYADHIYYDNDPKEGISLDQALTELQELIEGCVPNKQQTQATKNGAWYETEWDEGYNKAITDIKQSIAELFGKGEGNMKRKEEIVYSDLQNAKYKLAKCLQDIKELNAELGEIAEIVPVIEEVLGKGLF